MTEELHHILSKVHVLYLKYGIRSVTMDDIARELGISKKTLYQYVRDKDDLVSQVVDMEVARLHEIMSNYSRKHNNAIEELWEISLCISNMIKTYNPSTEYDLKKYYPDQYHKMNKLRKDHIFLTISENLKRGKEEGLYRKEIREDIICRIDVAFIDSMLENEMFSQEDYHNPLFFSEFIKYHLHGIVNKKGMKVLEQCIDRLDLET